MNPIVRIALIIICSAAVTFLTRLLPFLFFSGDKKVPGLILFIEKYLPGMIMVILVIYCFKDITVTDIPGSSVFVFSALVVALLHLLQKNALISIFGGTIFYMVLTRSDFIGTIPALFGG